MSPSAQRRERLARIPASDLKRRGWRGVMRTVRAEGGALVTNHDQPEAVILPAERYDELVAAQGAAEARIEQDLATLGRRFDERLAALGKADAGRRLRSVMRTPARLQGRVKAGKTF